MQRVELRDKLKRNQPKDDEPTRMQKDGYSVNPTDLNAIFAHHCPTFIVQV
jgi:hypothetical protein